MKKDAIFMDHHDQNNLPDVEESKELAYLGEDGLVSIDEIIMEGEAIYGLSALSF